MNSLESDQDQQYVWSWSGSIQFDTLIFFLKFLENIYFERSQQTTTKSLCMLHVKIYIKKFNAVWSWTIFLFFEQNNLFTKRYFQKTILKDLNDLTLSLLAASHLYLHCLLKLVCDWQCKTENSVFIGIKTPGNSLTMWSEACYLLPLHLDEQIQSCPH